LSEKTVSYIAFDLLDTGWNRLIIRNLCFAYHRSAFVAGEEDELEIWEG